MTAIALCTGYGGLELAVQAVIGGDLAYVADIDEGAAKILAARFPGVPNLGDIAAVDWFTLSRVVVLTAGFPCQDVSCAGARRGLRAGTRTGVWSHVAEAIAALRPSLVFLENVRGLLSVGADSDVECCPWCMGDSSSESVLRALGAVLADLADLGFDAEWQVVSADRVGAPHKRERVFILAWPAADADGATGGQRRIAAPGQAEGGWSWADARGRDRALAAIAEGDGRDEGRPEPARVVGGPDAAVSGDGAAADPAAADERRRGGGGRSAGPAGWPEPDDRSVGAAADADGRGRPPHEPGHIAQASCETAGGAAATDRGGSGSPAAAAEWGRYGPAIRRWEAVLGRPAPRPTEPGRTGERLSPRFVEWMMGLPEGWVTDVPGLPRNAQLKALGNGVVPQQAALALTLLLDRAGFTEAGEAA